MAADLQYDPQKAARDEQTIRYVTSTYGCMETSVQAPLQQGERDVEKVKAWLVQMCGTPLIRYLSKELNRTPEHIGDYMDRMAADVVRSTPGVKLDPPRRR
ncbi:MAG: hypothetical protein JWM53_5873 [bacterium]|nr:hypothetical protein [bacterium]